jgi:hypothetical protein
MCHPPVLQLGPSLQTDGERPHTVRPARAIALAARRCQELELERGPALAVHSRPIGDGRSKVMRTSAGAAAGIAVAVVIVYVLVASAGGL